MAGLAKAMWRQATHDLDHAERAFVAGGFDRARLAAQQAADGAQSRTPSAGDQA